MTHGKMGDDIPHFAPSLVHADGQHAERDYSPAACASG